MKQVTVVGSGNAFNMDGRAHACYLLKSSADDELLLDCGATSLLRLQESEVDLANLAGILLTHFHGDHYAGLPFLLIEMSLIRKREKPLTILGPSGVRTACERIIHACYPDIQFRFPIEYVSVKSAVDFASFRIEPFPITHRPESTGYRVTGPAGKSFAFSGDSACDEALYRLIDGVDLAIVECSMPEQTEPPTAHVALSEVRAARDCFKSKRLVFTHIYDDLARQVEAEDLAEVAHDGLVLHFD